MLYTPDGRQEPSFNMGIEKFWLFFGYKKSQDEA
jgi:hypothetical protein